MEFRKAARAVIVRKNSKPSCPIVGAIQNALGACLIGSRFPENSQIAVLSYADDFTALWALEDCQLLRSFCKSDFVIVLDDHSKRTSDLPEANNHLTALDWAVWFTLHRAEDEVVGQNGMPTIILLKMDKPGLPSSNDAQRFWSMFPENNVPGLPFIKNVPLIGRLGEPCCLLKLLQIIGGKPSPQPADLPMIKQVWQSFFLRPTQPSDNHSLSNLLGVGLLTGDFGESPTREALVKFMQTLDLLPTAEISQRSQICTKAILDAGSELHGGLPKKARRMLQFLLVDDDQQRHHWGRFLAQSLGLRKWTEKKNGWTGQIGKMQGHLSATDSAAEFLKALRASRNEGTVLNFGEGHAIDVLFLDLRLFRDLLTAEAQFFIEVIQELRKSNNSADSNPGDWPRVEEAELQRLEDWANLATEGSKTVTRNDEQYIDSLTLLPRLVAILFIDLPIILFSSTQRRRVLEILKPYGNIFTMFSKPTLQLGNSHQLVEETYTNFERATLAALDLVRAKRSRLFLINEEFSPYWRGHVETPIEEKADFPWTVQLLLDESEKKKKNKKVTKENKQRVLTVGGFLAIYPPGVCPNTFNEQIYKQYPNFREQTKESRRETLPTFLWQVTELAQKDNILLVPISLSGERTERTSDHFFWHTSNCFQDEMVEDNLHRELMRCLIEIGLFVFARQILPESSAVEFYFHAPARSLPVSDEEAEVLDSIWGIRTVHGLAKHFDHNSARSLLEEVFREYRDSIFYPHPVLARAYGLNTANKSEVAKVQALHYLADCWVSDNGGSDLKQKREIEIKGNYGPAMSRLLQAHRHLVHGEIASAIAIGTLVASEINNESDRNQAVNSIVVALQNAARLMTGPECLALAEALRQTQPVKTTQRVVGTVRSVSEKDSCIEIEWGGKVFRGSKADLNGPLSVGDLVQFVPRRGNRVGSFVARNVSKAETVEEHNELHWIANRC